jgi:hypothetical protein
VLNQAMEIIRPAGAIGIPGLYVTEDPGAHGTDARPALQSPAHDGATEQPTADREDRQCAGHQP